ncbi:MAG: polysaccharide deacetylase family protein, partial [Sporomusa sp.]
MNSKKMVRRNFFSISILVTGLVCALMYQVANVFNDKSRVIKQIPTTHKVVAITVDDGPHTKATPEILAVLKEKKAKATFFVLGKNAENHPEIIAQAVLDGHEIASHAYSHKRLNKLPAAEVVAELERLEAALQTVAPRPTLFRPPEGAYNDNIVALVRERGYSTILWSIDTGDWRRVPVDQVVKTVLDNVRPG